MNGRGPCHCPGNPIIIPAPAVCSNRRQGTLGEVTEWPIVLVSKTSVGASSPRVRIPPSPLSNKAPAVMLVAAGACVESLMAESLSVLKAIRCFWFERRML